MQHLSTAILLLSFTSAANQGYMSVVAQLRCRSPGTTLPRMMVAPKVQPVF